MHAIKQRTGGWRLEAMGDTNGSARLSDGRAFNCPCVIGSLDAGELVLSAPSGKFSNSEDSFLYLFCRIDPSRENFVLEATLSACHAGVGADQQSGFGLLVADVSTSPDRRCRHRNQLLVGTTIGMGGLGVRVVSGYVDPLACDIGKSRVVDEGRRFSHGERGLFSGEPLRLRLAKTDEGFVASYDGQDILVPGCDFLMRQDAGSICVGIAAARGVELTASEVSFEVSEGIMSHTPEGVIVDRVKDYPFSRVLLDEAAAAYGAAGEQSPAEKVLHVAPDGDSLASGTPDCPLTLEAAIARVSPGVRIIMADGVYRPTAPIVVPRGADGLLDEPIELMAEHGRSCVIDGTRLEAGQPLFVLDADNWLLEGLVFRNSPLSGLVVCGNMNNIVNCEAMSNADTGILIISRPGAPKEQWPQHNMVCDCDSHDNCDRFRSNADGFGAKLRIGKGNAFYRCVAYHNIDDGFDLYSKSVFGPCGPVELDCCVAYENGFLDAGVRHALGKGVGFKLGGERQAVPHVAWNCVAFRNGEMNFSANSNPECELHFCTTAGNGSGFVRESRRASGFGVCERLLTRSLPEDARSDSLVSRSPDGSLILGDALAPRTRGGKRVGAYLGQRKRVLFLIDSIGGGGAERVVCRLASLLSRRHDVALMYHVEKEDVYDVDPRVTLIRIEDPYEKEVHGFWEKAKRRMKFTFSHAIPLLEMRRRHEYDVTISLLMNPNMLNAVFGCGRRIVCERNDPSRKPFRYRLYSHVSCHLADYVVFQSKRVKGQYAGRVQDKSCILPNPVSVGCVAHDVSRKWVAAVGRLHPQKNFPLLIKAFAAFWETHPDYALRVFGEGDQRDELVRLAASTGAERAISLEGFCDDVHGEMADAAMFVLSSDYEGLSNALLEAMMMGLPCVSTTCAGSDELISDGEDGLLVPVGDEAALSDAMCRLADDEALRNKVARGARMRALDFAAESVIRKWERVL